MIVIRHTHEDGTLIEGTVKGDGVYEIAKQHGFRWFPSIRMIGLRGSRDHLARRDRINGLAEALRAAGHEVKVDIDDTPRARAQVLADQADRLDDRREALEDKATRRHAAAEEQRERADRIAQHRPPGQPILLGHHSQRRAERDQRIIVESTRRGIELGDQAREISRRADAVGSAAAYGATLRVTARRIKTTEAELRKIQRNLDGYTRQYRNGRGEVIEVEKHEPADGEWRERLLARKAQLEEQLAYDREHLEQAQADGRHVEYGPHNVHVGDEVHHGIAWCKVVKVNRTTVTVASPYGFGGTGKIPFVDIRQVRQPEPEQPDGAA